MRRSFKEIAESIIHWRHRHVRRKVTVALEDAYQTGLDDAASHLESTARDIRELSNKTGDPNRPLTDFSGYSHRLSH